MSTVHTDDTDVYLDSYLFETLNNSQNGSVRVKRHHAVRWLLENKCMIIGGKVRFLEIKHIGLDVYQVTLRPYGDRYTRLHGTAI